MTPHPTDERNAPDLFYNSKHLREITSPIYYIKVSSFKFKTSSKYALVQFQLSSAFALDLLVAYDAPASKNDVAFHCIQAPWNKGTLEQKLYNLLQCLVYEPRHHGTNS
jgi:hypothetical protein